MVVNTIDRHHFESFSVALTFAQYYKPFLVTLTLLA